MSSTCRNFRYGLWPLGKHVTLQARLINGIQEPLYREPKYTNELKNIVESVE